MSHFKSDHIGLRKRAALEIFRLQRDTLIKRHPLKALFWECTLRCNLNCIHCGSDCKKEAAKTEMPVVDFLRVAQEIKGSVNPNNILIIFTGGEALLREDIDYCGLELYKMGFPWGIVTNGMLLDENRLNSLMKCGIHTLTISLDGFEPEHNKMRGDVRSFANAESAIKLLCRPEVSSEILWDVVTCVTPMNINHLNRFREYLISMGVKSWRLFTVFPVGRAASDTRLKLDPADLRKLMDFIVQTREERKIECSYGCEGFLGGYEAEVRDNFYMCNAGITVSGILADGSIGACPSIRAELSQGNIYNHSFMDVWNNRYEKFRNREWAKKGVCKSCSSFRYCMGNGMHLRDNNDNLLFCHLHRLSSKGT